MQNNTIVNQIAGILLALALGVVGYLGVSAAQSWVKNQAIDGCLHASSYTSQIGAENAQNQSTEPINTWYEFCMREKGYK